MEKKILHEREKYGATSLTDKTYVMGYIRVLLLCAWQCASRLAKCSAIHLANIVIHTWKVAQTERNYITTYFGFGLCNMPQPMLLFE